MKRTILLALLAISAGALSLSSTKKSVEPQAVSFNKTTTAFKRNLGNAD